MKFNLLIFMLLFVCPLGLYSQTNSYLKARVAAENKDYTNALQHVTEYLQNYPNNKAAIFLSAQLNLEVKNYESAANALDKLKENYHDDMLLLIARANAGLGNKDIVFVQLDKYLESTKKLPEPLVKKYPEFELLSQTDRWKKLWEKERYSKKEVLLNNAIYAIKSGKFEEAGERLDELVSRYSRSDKGYYLKAKLLYQKKDFSNAFSTISKAVDLDGEVIDYQCLMADCYTRLGRAKKAVEKYQQILVVDSLYLPAYLGLAGAYLLQNEFDKALKNINYYRGYYPTDSQAQLLYADINAKSGDFLSAISMYGRLIKSGPKPEYYIGRANAYMETKTYKYAIKDYSMALDLDPKNIEVYKKKAEAHKLEGEMKKACAEWRNAAKLGDVESQDNLKRYCR